MKEIKVKSFVATRNACKVCTPLGASVAFKGIEGCVPVIHGSQGCATYIRRYLISHYKEPIDIASTNFTEESAIFGGEANLFQAIENVTKQYKPKVICIATTCLSETIGDDMTKIIWKYKDIHKDDKNCPQIYYVSTPSFKGTHMDGFHNAVHALVKNNAISSGSTKNINMFPGFLSPEDLRHLKEISADFKVKTIMVPDYSEILDYGHTGEYEKVPQGGTTVNELKMTGNSKVSIEMGYVLNNAEPGLETAAEYLEKNLAVTRINIGLPIGLRESDVFFKTLERVSGRKIPDKYKKQRERLVDSYVDGHKYVFGKKAVVYGEEDFVIGMVSFLEEIGIRTVLCASGGNSGYLQSKIEEKIKPVNNIRVCENYDFEEIEAECFNLKPDLLIGNSKGYYIARKYRIPLVRVGFPIHDRIGGQRIKHIGYQGTQELFDKITNALIEYKQEHSPVGYKYM